MDGKRFAIRIFNVEQVLWHWRYDSPDFRFLLQPLCTLPGHLGHIQGIPELAVLLTTTRIREPEAVAAGCFLGCLQSWK